MKRISWYFRKYHIKISPLIIYVNDTWDGWGFNLLAINKNLMDYSLLKLSWRSATGLGHQLDFYGDFLFLRNYLYKTLDDIRDRKAWSGIVDYPNKLSRWDKIKYKLLQKLFKQ